MKTAERENPNRRPQCVANRADGAASQYRSCSIMWAAKQENFQPAEKCFFLTSPFIELTGHLGTSTDLSGLRGSRNRTSLTVSALSNSFRRHFSVHSPEWSCSFSVDLCIDDHGSFV